MGGKCNTNACNVSRLPSMLQWTAESQFLALEKHTYYEVES